MIGYVLGGVVVVALVVSGVTFAKDIARYMRMRAM